MKILMIDNYDSFTFNLYQYLGEVLRDRHGGGGFDIRVKRNDEITIEEICREDWDRIVLSPGPGHPADPAYFGVCARVIHELGPKIPVLGVCLGMQGIVHEYGGRVIRADLPMHGKVSAIYHDGKGPFREIPQPLEVMRYHSLIADPTCLPDCLEVTALYTGNTIDFSNPPELTPDSLIMAVRHRRHPVYGIQFHPESFATEGGRKILENFLSP